MWLLLRWNPEAQSIISVYTLNSNKSCLHAFVKDRAIVLASIEVSVMWIPLSSTSYERYVVVGRNNEGTDMQDLLNHR